MVPLAAFSHYGPGTTPLGGQSPGPVRRRHHLVQPAARRLAERRDRRRSRRRRRRSACRRRSTARSPAPPRRSRNRSNNEPLLIAARSSRSTSCSACSTRATSIRITILSTLPSAGVGAVLALLLFDTEFSIIALIGVILLIGIVKKNAIMMIDFALAGRARAAASAARRDLPGLPAALPPDHDDDHRRHARRAAAGARHRRRGGAAPAARHLHRRRPDRQPGADALHHAGGLSVSRPLRRCGRAGAGGGLYPDTPPGAVPGGRPNEAGRLRMLLVRLAVGCTVGPDYQRPAAPVPPRPSRNLPPAGNSARRMDAIDNAAAGGRSTTTPTSTGWSARSTCQQPDAGAGRGRVPRGAGRGAGGARPACSRRSRITPGTQRARAAAARAAAAADFSGSVSSSGFTTNELQPGRQRELGSSTCGAAIRRTVESDVAGAQASAADIANARLSAQATLATDYFDLRAVGFACRSCWTTR